MAPPPRRPLWVNPATSPWACHPRTPSGSLWASGRRRPAGRRALTLRKPATADRRRSAPRWSSGGGSRRARRDPLRERAAPGGVVVGARGLPPDGAAVSLAIDVYGKNGLKRGPPIFNAGSPSRRSSAGPSASSRRDPSGNVPRYRDEMFFWDGRWVRYAPANSPWELTVRAPERAWLRFYVRDGESHEVWLAS